MNFEPSDLLLLGLLVVIASQTSYTTYRQWRDSSRSISGASGVLVDTSVLMDGRIMAIAEAGFLPGNLVVPRSVVGELQFLADNADSDKRERARRGLDVIKQLQLLASVNVELLQDGSKAPEGVDERLLALAKKHGMKLCTIDFNLNKVAQVENIGVLNVNELARNLRMSYLPGDKLSLDLTTGGSDSHQAVGHLEDGTMVVVEQARSAIGTHQEVEIIRSLQTAAGKMMFARLAGQSNGSASSKNGSSDRSRSKPSSVRRPQASSIQQNRRKPTSKPSSKESATKQLVKRDSTSKSTGGSRRKKSNEDRLIDLVDAQS